MLYELQPDDLNKVRDLFAPLEYNLAIASILEGNSQAKVYADHPGTPTAAFTIFSHRMFLAGSPVSPVLIDGLHQLFAETILPEAKAAGRDPLLLHVDNEAWETQFDAILPDLYPLKDMRSYFEYKGTGREQPGISQTFLPEGFTLLPVDAALLEQRNLGNLDYLRQELTSERSSVEEFFDKSFGVAALHDSELAAWCLSEYNTGNRCEVGVATVEKFARRGLGTAVTLALVEEAAKRGLSRIGWHCWKRNTPSVFLAQRAGFAHVMDYPVYLISQDTAQQFGYHGNARRSTGQWAEALEWYEKARAQGDPPAWVTYNAARCYARLGDKKLAFQRLREAIAHGFDDYEAIRTDPDLETLPRNAEWEALFTIENPQYDKPESPKS